MPLTASFMGSSHSGSLSTCFNHPKARYQATRGCPRACWNYSNQLSLFTLPHQFLSTEATTKALTHISPHSFYLPPSPGASPCGPHSTRCLLFLGDCMHKHLPPSMTVLSTSLCLTIPNKPQIPLKQTETNSGLQKTMECSEVWREEQTIRLRK